MEDQIKKLTAVRNALQTVTITATESNMNTLLGSVQTLAEVIAELQSKEEQNADQF